MKHTLLISALTLVTALSAQQTNPPIGTSAWAQQHSTNRVADPNLNPLNGNDTLNMTYSNTACGLNYTMVSQRLGQRFTPIGIPQPAPFLVSAMPACATVLKAYLYTEALGVAPGITATISTPANVTANVPMTLIGSSVDVCWGMNGTHVWRADVTSLVSTPGTYMIGGLPTTPQSSSGVDVEGATLIVIYQDPSASYTGSIQIDDGCHTKIGGSLTHNMTGFNACAASTSGSAFMLVGDMQMPGYTINMNGQNVVQPQWNWWNEISTATIVTSGQNSCNYNISTGGDCYTLVMAGLYFQTNCQACVPSTASLTVTATSTVASCAGNGSAIATATGGNGNYSYLWTPGGATVANPANLSPGTYTVSVTDGTLCGTATVTVGYNGPVVTTVAQPITCQGLGSAFAGVTGGTGPYTYLWSPSGGTLPIASNLTAGTYTVTVTDATGCVVTGTAAIANNSIFTGYISANPDICPSPSGSVNTTVIGGTAPYTYAWSNGATTQNISLVPAGVYSVNITDAAGCVVTLADTVVAVSGLTIATNQFVYASCGDTVNLVASSNDPSATYTWSPSATVLNPNAASTSAVPASSMTYYVTATGTCGTDMDSVEVYVDSLNLYNEQICFVTVDTSINKNVIIWERLNSPASGTYNIYRETSVSGVYALIGTQPVSQFTTYVDMTSNPQVMANRYVISTMDNCGQESDTSFHHRTIHLQVSPSMFGGYNLAWTAYEGLPISTYDIYRGPSISQMTLLTSVAGNVFTYTDVTAPSGNLWYMIEAQHPFGGCSPSLRLNQPNVLIDNLVTQSNLESTDDATTVQEGAILQGTLILFPNPNNGNFQLQGTTVGAGNVTIEVFNVLGQSVYSGQVAANGTFTHQMELNAAAGVYSVRIISGGQSTTLPVVIQR
jgi:hypothetical protein